MYYFNSLDHESNEDIDDLINTFVEFHHVAANYNYINKISYSCDSFFTLFDTNQHEKKYSVNNTKIQKNPLDHTKLQP